MIPQTLSSWFALPTDLGTLSIALMALLLAYTLFALLGFGTALIAGAPLAAVMPVREVIPLLALLDFVGASSRGMAARQRVDIPSLKLLLPGMVVGQLLGVGLLSALPPAYMALLLGGFIITQGWRGLRPAAKRAHCPAAFPQAILGGVLGGLFGSGGFMYAAYLERKLSDREAFRATQAVLIALSTAWRILLCTLSGLLNQEVLLIALMCSPAIFAGGWLGKHLDLRLSRQQLGQILHVFLIVAGSMLIYKHGIQIGT